MLGTDMRNRSLNRTRVVFVAIAMLAVAWLGRALAAEVTGLSWDEGAATPTLNVKLSGDTRFDAETLEGGLRLRLKLPGATLGPGAGDITGRANVRGVYPYVAENGSAVYVDMLMSEPGELKVASAAGGLTVAVSTATAAPVAAPEAPAPAPAVISAGTPASAPAARNAIEQVTWTKLPGDRVQLRMTMANPPAEPASFTISNPARISFDFLDTRVAMSNRSVRIAEGALVSVNAIEAGNRSRVVLNLVRPVAYKSEIDGKSYVVTLENPTVGIGAEPATAPKVTRFAEAAKAGKHSLKTIDFRRGPAGDGKIVIGLSDPGVGIDIREQAGEIVIDFLDTQVPAELQRRLDVIDFATPIQMVDTYAQGRNTRMVINARGKYEHLAYQAGDVFTVNVKPVVVKPGEEKPKDEFGYSGEKLSLNFQNIDVRAALQVIADFTELNFVTSDSVKGNITLRLKDVPWDQALDIILDSRNLAMRRRGNVVVVAPADEVAAKEKANLEATKQVIELEPLVSELVQINYAKAEDIAKLLKSIKAVTAGADLVHPVFGPAATGESVQATTESNTLLSSRGQVTVDERTNSLLIQDTPGKIREVRKLIAQLDQPVRQVMIETRLVEATDDFAKNLGVKWGVVRQDTINNNILTTCGTLNCNVDILNGDPVDLAGNALSVNLGANAIGGQSVGSIAATLMHLPNNNLLSLELSALEAEGKGKIISSPRLITANQKKARIEQGQERVFTTTVLGVGRTVTKKAVLALEVTPQITPDDRVILDVLVTKDSFADAVTGVINKKEITTQVLLDNGETIVIGGIYEQTTTNTITKVPYLGDIPGLGWAFKKKNLLDNKTELLIFLTPRIMSDSLSLSSR